MICDLTSPPVKYARQIWKEACNGQINGTVRNSTVRKRLLTGTVTPAVFLRLPHPPCVSVAEQTQFCTSQGLITQSARESGIHSELFFFAQRNRNHRQGQPSRKRRIQQVDALITVTFSPENKSPERKSWPPARSVSVDVRGRTRTNHGLPPALC